MLTTKEKGDIGVTKVIAEATEMGVNVSLPIGEHLKYDLIMEKYGKMYRVQSKYTKHKDGKIEVKIQSAWSDKKGNHVKSREKGDYDILAVYCPYTKKCYFLSDNDFDTKTAVTLRISAPKCLSPNIRWAKDYENINNLFKIG